MSFDWREGQPFLHAGIIANPGTGPVHGATREQAALNMAAFVDDLASRAGAVAGDFVVKDSEDEDEGRFAFTVSHNDRTTTIDMPGLPVEAVRYMNRATQSILDFPRLYVDGSSWVWCYALNSALVALGYEDQM